ncbi:AEL_collapsed_G0046410.mRNA.1.CDS.1 [Saccharomyces cerevisiae]|nr:AEL_collapsed_G0046410.mRNA.1.CDS.1 [Saccharomyces cerevisiae]
MCRFLIFKGKQPIRLSHLLTRPAHSIINQSFDSRLRLDRRRPMNGDGFGVAYYPLDTELSEDGPCLFKAITPAWNNQNLSTLAEKTKSDLVFAHVRASTYGVLSETNCHPFTYHSLCFMHNGGISNFKGIKRKLLNHIKDEYLNFIQGSTDSECAFALFLDTLDKLGYDPKK